MSSNELSSFSACAFLQVRGESAYVLDMIRERLEYPALKRRVIEMHRHWSSVVANYALLIENKGSGMSLIQDLRHDHIYAVPIEPVVDKIMRMNAQSARIEAGSRSALDGWMLSRVNFLHSPTGGTTIRSTPYCKG